RDRAPCVVAKQRGGRWCGGEAGRRVAREGGLPPPPEGGGGRRARGGGPNCAAMPLIVTPTRLPSLRSAVDLPLSGGGISPLGRAFSSSIFTPPPETRQKTRAASAWDALRLRSPARSRQSPQGCAPVSRR